MVITPDPTGIRITTSPPPNMGPGQTYVVNWVIVDSEDSILPGVVLPVNISSSNPAVAQFGPLTSTTTSTSICTAVGGGTTTILVRNSAFSIQDTQTVTVTSPQNSPSYISITQTGLAGLTGSAETVYAVVYDAGSIALTGQTMTWSSTSAAVFTVGSDFTNLDPQHQALVTYVGVSSSTVTLTATV